MPAHTCPECGAVQRFSGQNPPGRVCPSCGALLRAVQHADKPAEVIDIQVEPLEGASNESSPGAGAVPPDAENAEVRFWRFERRNGGSCAGCGVGCFALVVAALLLIGRGCAAVLR